MIEVKRVGSFIYYICTFKSSLVFVNECGRIYHSTGRIFYLNIVPATRINHTTYYIAEMVWVLSCNSSSMLMQMCHENEVLNLGFCQNHSDRAGVLICIFQRNAFPLAPPSNIIL